MKTQFAIITFLLIYSLTALSQKPAESYIKYDANKKKLESFTALNLNNELKSIELKTGKYFLLDSSIPGCKGCLKEIPKLLELNNQHSDKLDIILLWSHAGNYENWKNYLKFMELNDVTIPMVLDTKNIINQTFEINVFPTYMLFDKNGILIKKWKGRIPKNIDKYLN